MPRAVLDPNVLVSALISPRGPCAQLLLELRAGAFELVTSHRLLSELDEVLHRPKFRRYATEAEVDGYIELLRRESVVIDDPPDAHEPLGHDPDDENLIPLAREARVDALVSGDSHVQGLRKVIPVRTPREFLESLQKA